MFASDGACAGGVYGRGMGTGTGIQVGGAGYTGYPASLLEERSSDSEAGPGRACRALEWVVTGARTPAALGPPLPAVGPASLSQHCSPGNTRLWTNKGEN